MSDLFWLGVAFYVVASPFWLYTLGLASGMDAIEINGFWDGFYYGVGIALWPVLAPVVIVLAIYEAGVDRGKKDKPK